MFQFAQTALWNAIPLFLLTFGILYLVLGYLLHGMHVHLALPVAVLAIAGSLGWFVVRGAGFGGMFLPPEVLTVLGVGIVAIVLAKVFAGH